MMRQTIRTLGVLFVALATLLLATCISAEEKDLVKYDPATDEFRMLMLLRDIQVKEPDDLAYLEAIYKNRDHLIAPVIPGGAAIFPLLAVSAVRTADTQASFINIFSQRPTSLELVTTAANLGAIKITPGAFFLENGKLGYYQAINVPGKLVDTVLAELSKSPGDDIGKGIDEELKRRADGGKTNTWAELKEDTLKRIVIKPAEAAGESINPIMVLNEQSLKNIKAAAAAGGTDKSMQLARAKQSLTLSLPLIAADAKEAADLVHASINRLDQVVKETKETPENADQLKVFKGILPALKAVTAAGDDKGFLLSVDILKLAEVAAAGAPTRIDLNGSVKMGGEGEAPKEVPPDVIAYLKDKKIAIDDKLTADQITKDFNANTLKPNLSQPPAKPGEGIAKPKE